MLHMREKSTKKWNVITISKMVLAARLRGTSHKYHSNARSDTPHDAMIKVCQRQEDARHHLHLIIPPNVTEVMLKHDNQQKQLIGAYISYSSRDVMLPVSKQQPLLNGSERVSISSLMNLCVLESYFAISQRTQPFPMPQSSSQEDDVKAQSITSEEGQPG